MPTRARIDCRLLCVRFLLAMWAATACLFACAATPEEDFMIAVANDHVGQVRELLARGVDPNAVDQNGDPALVVAARAGNVGTVDALLAGRANVNARNKFGDTAIMAAA